MMYAEEVNYWKTSKSSPGVWLERAEKQVVDLGGTILVQGIGQHPATGNAAYIFAFTIGKNNYRVVWPVLQSKTEDIKAARRQAATMLYHDVKARCISAKVLGVRTAFFAFLMLPDGRAASEVEHPEIITMGATIFITKGSND